MGKKKNKKKEKKVSAKKLKYTKFRKDKPAALDVSMPELNPEQMKQKREDELEIERFLRSRRSPPPKVPIKLQGRVKKRH